MSGWDFIRKMIQGKPVFDPSDVKQPFNEHPPAPVETPPPVQRVEVVPAPTVTPLVDDQGHKLIPQLALTHCKSHVSGDQLEVRAWVTNASNTAVRVDAGVLLGQKTRLDRDLDPGQAHEVLLYRGPAPQDDTSHKAELYYKIRENGDAFCADYMIEYYHERSGAWLVEELRPERIVHDL